MAAPIRRTDALLLLLSVVLSALLSLSAPTASAKHIRLNFYMLIIPQNQSMLNMNGEYTAVRTAAPAVTQNFTFGVLNTFDSLISKTNSTANPSDIIGRIQGWYGDCGQDYLALCLAQTFSYNDTRLVGTFSLIGVSIASTNYKESPIVGGTGDFAYCRGIAGQERISQEYIKNEEHDWFRYNITMKC